MPSDPRGGPPETDPPRWEDLADLTMRGVVAAIAVLNVLNAFVIVTADFDNSAFRRALLDAESNPATWLASAILLVAGACAIGCGIVDARANWSFWRLAGLALVAMSLEEVAQLHELVSGNITASTDGWGPQAIWVFPGIVLVLALLGLLARRARDVDRSVLARLAVGSVVFVIGSLGFELLNEATASEAYDGRRYLTIATIEENIELLGAGLLAHTSWSHLRTMIRARTSP